MKSLSHRQAYQPCSSCKRGVKKKQRGWMRSASQILPLNSSSYSPETGRSSVCGTRLRYVLLGCGKDLSKEKAGSVLELPPKQGGLERTLPAHQSTQNKLCVVPKDINKRFFNFHASPCNFNSFFHTCIWKCSSLKYKCSDSLCPSRKPGTSINNIGACQYPETHNTG